MIFIDNEKDANKLEYVLSYSDNKTIIVLYNDGIVDNAQNALKMHSKLNRYGMCHNGMSFYKYESPVTIQKVGESFIGYISGTKVFTINAENTHKNPEEEYVLADSKKYFILKDDTVRIMIEVTNESGSDFDSKIMNALNAICISDSEMDSIKYKYQTYSDNVTHQMDYVSVCENEKINVDTFFTIKSRYNTIATSIWTSEMLTGIEEPWFLMYIALTDVRGNNDKNSGV